MPTNIFPDNPHNISLEENLQIGKYCDFSKNMNQWQFFTDCWIVKTLTGDFTVAAKPYIWAYL